VPTYAPLIIRTSTIINTLTRALTYLAIKIIACLTRNLAKITANLNTYKPRILRNVIIEVSIKTLGKRI
jgi:hypothetical protein